MAYNFVKLSETTLVESAADHNLLIEDGGEIKRISANNATIPQVQSDWNETDANNPAFILNKPESIGKNNVITYTLASSTLMLDGSIVTTQSVVDAWNNGNILRIAQPINSASPTVYPTEGIVLGVCYTLSNGTVVNNSCTVSYYLSLSIQSVKV